MMVAGVREAFADAPIESARIAILIANSNYPDASLPQQSAAKDASLLADELGRDSFDVDLKKDLTRDGMRAALESFLSKIKPGTTALLYFNGIGIQVAHQTYLIPTNAEIWSEADVKHDGTNVDSLVAEMQRRGAAVKIVIIDASRRNPFERRFRSYSAGLAGLDAPEGTLVIYATAPNKVGPDSTGDLSLFMSELVKELRTPNISAEDAIMHTRVGVSRASNGEQVPWFASSLVDPIYFGHMADASTVTPPPPETPPPAPPAKEPPTPPSSPPPAPPSPPAVPPAPPSPPLSPPSPPPAAKEPVVPPAKKPPAAETPPAAKEPVTPPPAETPAPPAKEPPKETPASPAAGKSPHVMHPSKVPAKEPPAPPPAETPPPAKEPPPLPAEVPPPPAKERPPAPPAQEPPLPPAQQALDTPGTIFRDCPNCPEMMVLGAGSFLMGSGTTPFDRPPHKVTIGKPFAISRNEVTFDDWAQCQAGGGCSFKPDSQGFGEGDHPVINVSWTDAKDYAAWLSKKTGKVYRLPTEAEWEYAARGGTTTAFSWGPAVGSRMANCSDCGVGHDTPHTTEVRSFPPNPYGLYDMAGNAAEWVEDCWNATYRGAPKDGSAWLAGNCEQRVLRGGSFSNPSVYAKPSARFRYDSDVRYLANGFRLVREVP